MKIGVVRRFFMVMGIIFSVLVLLFVGLVIYIVTTHPFGIGLSPASSTANTQGPGTTAAQNPYLTPSQQSLLNTIGVDTTKLPTSPSSITPQQEACAVSKLGQARVDEIKNGSSISTSDILKAGSCFK